MMGNKASTEYYNKVCSAFAVEIAKYTPQLFEVKDHVNKLPPKAVGSAVLITADQRYFLITAAHCVHEVNLEHIGVMIDNDFCTIGGQLRYYETNEEELDPNNADMAVFELDSVTANTMKEKYEFTDWSKAGLNHLSNQFAKYLIFGYPASTTRKHFPTKQINPEPLVLRTIGVPSEYYSKEQIDRNKTLILYGNQKSVGRAKDAKIEELPQLGGISGCGLWVVYDIDTKPQYKLAALVTGEDWNKTVLYCSRIDNVEKALRLQFNVNLT